MGHIQPQNVRVFRGLDNFKVQFSDSDFESVFNFPTQIRFCMYFRATAELVSHMSSIVNHSAP